MKKLLMQKISLFILCSFLSMIISDSYPLYAASEQDGVALIEKGEAEYSDGLYLDALSTFSQAIGIVKSAKNKARLLLDLSLVHYALNDPEKCKEYLRTLMDANPKIEFDRKNLAKGFLLHVDEARDQVNARIAEQKKLAEQKQVEELKAAAEKRSLENNKKEEENKTANVAMAGGTDQSVAKEANQQPQVKKKRKFPWLLAVLGAGAVIALVAVLLSKTDDSSDNPQSDPGAPDIDMISVPGGSFQMGSISSESYADEQPIHTVTLSAFQIGKYEVTQGQWKAVMGSNPSYFAKGDNYPVEMVSWDDVQAFIQKLNNMSGKQYRLPTEAEWEYACRAGTTGDRYGSFDAIAWNSSNSDAATHPVGQKQANAWGLYDMLGNVWEWCSDWYGPYSSAAQTNPGGPASGTYRCTRGACWSDDARATRAPLRGYDYQGSRRSGIGFRVARTN